MAIKINITLNTHDDYKLLVESVKNYRAYILHESQKDGITAQENAELIHTARQLYNLADQITK